MRAPEFWDAQNLTTRLAVRALTPLGWVYGASVSWKAKLAAPSRAKAKVICIGNLTAGGTGKTPVAIAVASALRATGHNPVFLTRGYGGKVRGPCLVDPSQDSAADVGDEPLLLAAAAPVIVSRDRAAGAKLADSQGFDTIVMDDGHQNFALAKDLSLVVVDAAAGFGNDRVLPAGPLREPIGQGLSRADAVVLVGDGAPPLADFSGPVLRAQLRPAQKNDLAGQRVIAFAGIGRPEKFFATLRDQGAVLIEKLRYADHHTYTAAEIARLNAKARDNDALLITTEKDYVRLTPMHREGIMILPVQARFEDEGALTGLLSKITTETIS